MSGRSEQESARGYIRRHQLKFVLLLGDALSIMCGYVVVLFVGPYSTSYGNRDAAILVAAGVVAGLWAARSQGLFLARISSVRMVELTRITRAMVLLAAMIMVVDRVLKLDLRIREAILASLVSWALFISARSAYRAWLSFERSRGRHQRRVLVVGTDEEATRLVELFATHAELGLTVVGVVGDRIDASAHGLGGLWLGECDATEQIVAAHEVSGVVVSPMALPTTRLNSLIRHLQINDVHVHLATGIAGIDARRLRSMPMSHEPLLYVEPLSLSRLQLATKRVFDVLGAVLILILASPALLLIAIAIKLQDGGPVFFRQERVGRRGAIFEVLKFRTMAVDAEAQLARLRAANERNGPLFKMGRDPRVTAVGRFLRESSLDELPQLINVLRGEMSLVGPRPALPSEVSTFSADLRQRELVLPGITGLWQVEARDNPSFEAYRRLDLFYVENWSITLDFIIILGTIEHLALRVFLLLRPGHVAPPTVALPVVQPSTSSAQP